MILIAGGTGRLGQMAVPLLTSRGLRVRVLTRRPEEARHLYGGSDLVEIVSGDARDPQAVKQAMSGVQTVISAIHGFAGTGNDNPGTVDWQGNANLIHTAQANGVEHFILMSIHGAAPDHSMELMRMKYKAEQELRASKLGWTIIRATAYMELWAELLGVPLVSTGKTMIFGRGDSPINFVSVRDVAGFIELAVLDPQTRGTVIEVGGPQNLSMNQFVRSFQALTGKAAKVQHVPLAMMRVMSVLMRPVNPALARQIQSGVVMDTRGMSFDALEVRLRYPSIPLTRLEDVLRRDYAVHALGVEGAIDHARFPEQAETVIP